MSEETIASILRHAPADYFHGWGILRRKYKSDLEGNVFRAPIETVESTLLPTAGASIGTVGPMEVEAFIQHFFTKELPYPWLVIPIGIVGGVIGLLSGIAATPQAIEGRHQRHWREQNRRQITTI